MVMKDEPLLSVIVPIYNADRYLSRCVDSILRQTAQNLEVLLVNDGSTDRSGAIIDDYAVRDNRVRAIHQFGGGVSRARNAGLNAASGTFIGFVDSDDWIEPDMFEKLLNLAVTGNAQIAMCGYVFENGKEKPTDPVQTGLWDKRTAFENVLQPIGFQGYLCNKIFFSELFNKLILNESIHFCEDLLCVCQAVLKCETIAYTTEQLYHYFIHPLASTSQFCERSLTELTARDMIINLPQPDSSAAKASYSNSASFLLCKYYQSKYSDKAIEKLLRNEARRYLREFRQMKYPFKENIRMRGILLCPPIFCPLWNFIKTADLAVSCGFKRKSPDSA